MVTEVKVSEHKTPKHSLEKLRNSRITALENHFGDQLTICGYCGFYKARQYVCSCGWDCGYGDTTDEEGNSVPVWFKES